MSSELEDLIDERSLSGEKSPTCKIVTADQNVIEGDLKGYVLSASHPLRLFSVTLEMDLDWINDGLAPGSVIESCTCKFDGVGKQITFHHKHAQKHVDRIIVHALLKETKGLVTLEFC